MKFIESKVGKYLYPIIASVIGAAIFAFIIATNWEKVLILLTRKIVAWHLLIMITVSFAILYAIERYKRTKQKQPKPPQFTEYTKDKFGDILYKWKWYRIRNTGKWNIEDLSPYCEDCNCRIIYSVGTNSRYHCPNCQTNFHVSKSNEGISALIESRLESKYF